jgi:hypothetical protein
MVRSGAVHFSMLLLIFFAAPETSIPARAGSTAMRCDADGCAFIHCNATGDRCYHYGVGHGLPPGQGIRPLQTGRGGQWHRICDSDGDRCYFAHGRSWDFREYYRRLGYHWSGVNN